MTIRWGRRAYTQEQFIEAWNSSTSISEVAKKLNTNRSGSGFYSLRNAAIELGLTQDHMPEDRIARTAIANKRPLSEVLVEDSTYQSTNSLKKRLYSEGLAKRECYSCGISEWLGKPAPLALDHINGVRSDNRIENLRILCYNCHGQTETFGSKNKAKRL